MSLYNYISNNDQYWWFKTFLIFADNQYVTDVLAIFTFLLKYWEASRPWNFKTAYYLHHSPYTKVMGINASLFFFPLSWGPFFCLFFSSGLSVAQMFKSWPVSAEEKQNGENLSSSTSLIKWEQQAFPPKKMGLLWDK